MLKGAQSADASPRALVGAFGKHPGWDDHIDDIGLDSERLVSIKRVLYSEGISANVDSGAWENLDPSQRLESFDHDAAWWLPSDLTVGRVWSSSDGKGRTKYPMALLAQCTGCSPQWALTSALDAVRAGESRCKALSEQSAVIAAISSLRSELAARIADAPGLGADPGQAGAKELLLDSRAALRLIDELAPPGADTGGSAPEPLARAFYAIRSQCAGYLPDAPPERSRAPAALRLPVSPRISQEPGAALSAWLTILLATLDPATPILLVKPAGASWVDALIGEPGPQQVFALRAGETRMSKVSDVPYTLDAASSRLDADLLARLRRPGGLAIPLARRGLLSGSTPSRLKALLPIAGAMLLAASTSPRAACAAAEPTAPAATAPTAPVPAVAPVSRVDARARYNQLLQTLADHLSAQARPAMDDEQVRRVVTEFIQEVRQLPGGIAYLREADQTLQALQRAIDASTPEPVATRQAPRLGPGALPGVIVTLLPDGRARFLLPAASSPKSAGSGDGADGPVLEFVRVVVPEAGGGRGGGGSNSPLGWSGSPPPRSRQTW